MFVRGLGAIPAFCLPKKERGTPTQKLSRIKQRKGLAKHNLKKRKGGRLKQYEKDLQEKTTAGRIFLLPNEIFTLGLSAREIAVYAYLIFCEDRETHLCYPSFRKIGEHIR